MFAYRLASPFVLLALIFLYLAWTLDPGWAIWIVPFLLAAAVIFIFSAEINWWHYQRRPPRLDSALARLLGKHCAYYQRLDPQEQRRFRERVALFRIGTDWTPMGWPEEMEKLPPDVELALAAPAVMLTFHQPEFLFHRFEKVIVYPRAFPSPEYPFPHSSELYEEDGCLIFSAEHLMLGFLQAGARYHIGLHEYAYAYLSSWPDRPYPALPEEGLLWEKLEAVSGLSRQQVEGSIGIAGLPVLPVAIHHYFIYPERFAAELPDVAAGLKRVFAA
ncbi:MAG TPA: zinc-dependent peptidase [Saprospiraceae bacterium]|nr:zinc-dependent peptidase [Saprospiraceae bacterium]